MYLSYKIYLKLNPNSVVNNFATIKKTSLYFAYIRFEK